MKKTLLIALLVGLAVPSIGLAATFLSEEIFNTTGSVEDDLYVAGTTVSIEHPVAEDAFVAGENVLIDSAIGQDLFAAGANLLIQGHIGDDAYVAGETVTLDSTTDDVFAAGATVELTNENTVSGDAYVAGETITIGGTIEGTVRAAGSTVVIRDGATIGGDLRTYGPNEPTIGDSVTITGTREHTTHKAEFPTAQATALLWVRSVITLFVGAFVLLLLAPASTKRVMTAVVTKPAQHIGLGFLALLLFVPVAITLFITMIGAPLGFLVLFLAVVALIMGWLYSALIIGERAFTWITKKDVTELSWQHALLGAVIINVLGLIPVLGWLTVVVVSITATGAVLATRWQELRSEND